MVDIFILNGSYKPTYNWGDTTLYISQKHPDSAARNIAILGPATLREVGHLGGKAGGAQRTALRGVLHLLHRWGAGLVPDFFRDGNPVNFTRPGKRSQFVNWKITMLWENSLFLWPFSIANC